MLVGCLKFQQHTKCISGKVGVDWLVAQRGSNMFVHLRDGLILLGGWMYPQHVRVSQGRLMLVGCWTSQQTCSCISGTGWYWVVAESPSNTLRVCQGRLILVGCLTFQQHTKCISGTVGVGWLLNVLATCSCISGTVDLGWWLRDGWCWLTLVGCLKFQQHTKCISWTVGVGWLLNVPATCSCISGTVDVGWWLNVSATCSCISGTVDVGWLLSIPATRHVHLRPGRLMLVGGWMS